MLGGLISRAMRAIASSTEFSHRTLGNYPKTYVCFGTNCEDITFAMPPKPTSSKNDGGIQPQRQPVQFPEAACSLAPVLL